MGLLRIYSVLMGGVLIVGVFLSACGGVEPAPSLEDRAEDSVAAESQSTRVDEHRSSGEEKSDMIETDGDGDVDGGTNTVDVADESGETEETGGEKAAGCVQMCAMLEQCHGLPDGVATLEDCQAGCAQSLYDGVLMERDIRCVEAANDCRELSDCMQNFWGCDEPCDSFMQCELQDEPDECRQWCGVGIASGAVRIEQFHCMERLSTMQLCSELVETCGLSWML